MGTIDSPTKPPEAFESEAPTLGLLLIPDETANLQEIYTSLSFLLTRLSAISEGFAEREEVIRRQSRCNVSDDKSVPPARGAIAESLCAAGIEASDLDLIELGHSDSSGPRGCNPYTPIGSIMMDLLRAQDKIERIIHIESPQTTSSLESLLTCHRLSDGGSIHERIDKSTGTNNCL